MGSREEVNFRLVNIATCLACITITFPKSMKHVSSQNRAGRHGSESVRLVLQYAGDAVSCCSCFSIRLVHSKFIEIEPAMFDVYQEDLRYIDNELKRSRLLMSRLCTRIQRTSFTSSNTNVM